MGRLAFLGLLACCAIAAADETVVFKKSDGGVRIMTLHTGGGTSVVDVPKSRVLSIGGLDVPDKPTPTPNPDGKSIGEIIASAYADVTDSDKSENARKIAAIYRTVGNEVAKGAFKNTSEVGPVVKRLTDTILGGDAEKWSGFRSVLGAELTRRGKAGQLGTSEQIATLFKEIADSMDAVAVSNLNEGQRLESDESITSVIALILKLLPLILEIIRGFGG